MSTKLLLAFALFGLPLMACAEDPVTTIDRSTDCSTICGRYKDCINTDYDVDSCEKNCTAMKTDAETSTIDKCEECVDGKSCTNAVFNCTTECAGIVP
jgi:hypothetical protein